MKYTVAKKIERCAKLISDKLKNNYRVAAPNPIDPDDLRDLSEEEKIRVLTLVAYGGIRKGDDNTTTVQAMKVLGSYDESSLVFILAATYEDPCVVPCLVRTFCRNTKIARYELHKAVFGIINEVQVTRNFPALMLAVECVRLYKPKFGDRKQGTLSMADIMVRKIWLATTDCLGDSAERSEIGVALKKLVNNEGKWRDMKATVR